MNVLRKQTKLGWNIRSSAVDMSKVDLANTWQDLGDKSSSFSSTSLIQTCLKTTCNYPLIKIENQLNDCHTTTDLS